MERGDGAGFDIRSFTESGEDKFIEVKATKYGAATPFYFTANELAFSQAHAERYYLYRVFNLLKDGRFYVLSGSLQSTIHYESTQYRGWPKT